MTSSSLAIRIASLRKAELHLHLEGSIRPATVCALAARHGILIAEEEVRRRYAYRGFPEFIEAFKWVTSFLREPQDYALIAHDLAEHLLTQGVVYAEVTLSVGVMLLRGQQPEANFEALLAPPSHSKPADCDSIGSSTPPGNLGRKPRWPWLKLPGSVPQSPSLLSASAATS